MEKIILNMIVIIFPILMYLVFSCYKALNNKRIEKMVFIVTILTSLYLCLRYNFDNERLLIFCNIPILICYFKKEGILGFILSLIIILVSYFGYGLNLYAVILKYLSYFVVYRLLFNKKEFNYLFFKISAVIQGFFASFEYFLVVYDDFLGLVNLIMYILIIYVLTFFSLYLFKLADDVSKLFLSVNKINKESNLKNSLFKLTHEIKNPIAVCKGYLDMINLENTEKSKKYIEIIKSEIDRSLNVIADFTEYSKIKIKKEIFDVVMLMDDVYESFLILVNGKNIKFNYNNKYDEIYLWGDYDRLKQVLVNVIKNSIESLQSGGIIEMSILIEERYVNIIVSDNGIGMTKEELANIKEMFFTTKKDGTGLGVALSNEIVLAHNGVLSYESEKNVGTKCTIRLPI